MWVLASWLKFKDTIKYMGHVSLPEIEKNHVKFSSGIRKTGDRVISLMNLPVMK